MFRVLPGLLVAVLCLGLASVGLAQTEDSSPPAAQAPLQLVLIEVEEAKQVAEQLEREGYDVLEGSVDHAKFEIAVNEQEHRQLYAMGFSPILLDEGRPLSEIFPVRSVARGIVPTGYPDQTAINADLTQFATNFPAICQMVNITQTFGGDQTFEGRDIFGVKISDSVDQDEDEPTFLLVSTHHAREIVTPILALNAIDELTSGYAINPDIKAIVDNHEIWIIPVWNPDGYEAVFNVDNLWRKNRRVFSGGTGVDLNRNYAFGWDTPCGGSTTVTSQTYRGPVASSEPETLLMELFTEDRRFAKVIDYHSSGRETLWGYACQTHPFGTFLSQIATQISTASGYNTRIRSPSAEGEHYEWQLQRWGSFAFLVETHVEFQPSFSSAETEADTTWPGVKWFLEQPIPVSGHVTDGQGMPLEATITFDTVSPNGEAFYSGPRFGRYAAFLPPGNHRLTFRLSGGEEQVHDVTVLAGQNLTLNVTFGPTCRGDLNGDSQISVMDLVDVVRNFGLMTPTHDLNSDGIVTELDLLLAGGSWGGCLP